MLEINILIQNNNNMKENMQFDERIKDFMLKAKGKVHYDNVFREFKDRFNTPNATCRISTSILSEQARVILSTSRI